MNSKFAPLKKHENILVFAKKSAAFVKKKENAMRYNPQMGNGKPYTITSGRATTNYDTKWAKRTETINTGERYPTSILQFKRDKEKFHPTQKPIALFEYLIKTYTNEGDTVLDNCMGSGTTAIACINLKRNFVGFEKDESYFEIANLRIKNNLQQLRLF